MEVQILSRKLLTPSSSHKVDHPPTHKLSCIDQLAPPAYVDIIFYYTAAADDVGEHDRSKAVQREMLMHLEKSLSETLTVFYPLAGRYVEDDLSIDCSDQGIEFMEAQVKGLLLNDLLLQQQPDAKLLSRFSPPYMQHSPTSPLLSIQVNMFECGGFAIGLHISHLVADGYTAGLFTNVWANACRSAHGINPDQRQLQLHPSFSLASIFPSRHKSAISDPTDAPSGPNFNVVTKRFVFDGKAISRLKAATTTASGCKPSRVLVVTALIWGALMRVSKARHGGQLRASLAAHAFNLRGKTNLPIPEHCCGNLWRLIHASFTPNGESKMEFQGLVDLVEDAMRNAKIESAKPSLTGDDIFLMARNGCREVCKAKNHKNEIDLCDFTSWCRMCHYEVDFGWGKPSWVSSIYIPLDGFIVFLDTKNGDGIEAWVGLDGDKMLLFEQDHEILASTTIDLMNS